MGSERRALAGWGLWVCLLWLLPGAGWAEISPEAGATIEAGLDKCQAEGNDPFEGKTCLICGVELTCNRTVCQWGAVTYSRNGAPSTTEGARALGYLLYCVNGSGNLAATRSAVARQAVTLGTAFRRADAGPTVATSGFSSVDLAGAVDISAGEAIGAAVPYGFGYGLGSAGRVDVDGDAFFTRSPDLMQFGVNAKGYYQLYAAAGEGDAGSTFAGATVPLQFNVTTGGLEAIPGYQVGAGALAGYSVHRGGSTYGAGIATDLIRAGALQLPTQVVGRYGVPWSGTWNLVVQPGVSVNVLSDGDLLDTAQVGLLSGLEWGVWVFGAQLMYLGDENFAAGLTVTRLDALGQSVAAGHVVSASEAAAAAEAKPPQLQLAEALRRGDLVAAVPALVAPASVAPVAPASVAPLPVSAPSSALASAPAPAPASVEPVPPVEPVRPAEPVRLATSVAEVDAAVAELACERLAGRPEAEGCAAAATSASRSVEAGQWAAAWQAWYGHQMRTGRKPALDFNALNREAAAFGAEARELADLAQRRSLDRARFLSRKRVATHPLALTWLPSVRATLESSWGERVQAVAVAETWDALLVSLPAAVDLTFAFDPAGTPPELRSLSETALAARRGDLAAAEPVLLTLAISGHPQAAMMADRVRVLAGRDAAARALVEARSGRLVAGLAHLATAERLAPGDETVAAAGFPLRASAAGERARVFGAVEASGDPPAVATGLGQAALLLRANPSDPQDVADAYACEAWAAAIGAWPAETPERRAARLVTLGTVDRAPLAEAQRALRRALVADTARVTAADVSTGRVDAARGRVDALKRLFPDEPGFQPPLDEALAAAAGQKLAVAVGAARMGRWASTELRRRYGPEFDAEERARLGARTAEGVVRGQMGLLPALRLSTTDPALAWAAPALVGDHGGWLGVTTAAHPATFAPTRGAAVTGALIVDTVRYTPAPRAAPAAPAPVSVRVRVNPERRACEAAAQTPAPSAPTDATRCQALPEVLVERGPSVPTPVGPTERTGEVVAAVRLVADDTRLGELHRFSLTRRVTLPDPQATDAQVESALAVAVVEALRGELAAAPAWLLAGFDRAVASLPPGDDRTEWAARAWFIAGPAAESPASRQQRLKVACEACRVPAP